MTRFLLLLIVLFARSFIPCFSDAIPLSSTVEDRCGGRGAKRGPRVDWSSHFGVCGTEIDSINELWEFLT